MSKITAEPVSVFWFVMKINKINNVIIIISMIGLERTLMKGVFSGRRGRYPPMLKWPQDIKETLVMRVFEARELATS